MSHYSNKPFNPHFSGDSYQKQQCHNFQTNPHFSGDSSPEPQGPGDQHLHQGGVAGRVQTHINHLILQAHGTMLGQGTRTRGPVSPITAGGGRDSLPLSSDPGLRAGQGSVAL